MNKKLLVLAVLSTLSVSQLAQAASSPYDASYDAKYTAAYNASYDTFVAAGNAATATLNASQSTAQATYDLAQASAQATYNLAYPTAAAAVASAQADLRVTQAVDTGNLQSTQGAAMSDLLTTQSLAFETLNNRLGQLGSDMTDLKSSAAYIALSAQDQNTAKGNLLMSQNGLMNDLMVSQNVTTSALQNTQQVESNNLETSQQTALNALTGPTEALQASLNSTMVAPTAALATATAEATATLSATQAINSAAFSASGQVNAEAALANAPVIAALTAKTAGINTTSTGTQITGANNVVSVGNQAIQIVSATSSTVGFDRITTDGNTIDGNLHLGGVAVDNAGAIIAGKTVNVIVDGALIANGGFSVTSGQSINLGGNVVTGVGNGVLATDAANLGQVQAYATSTLATSAIYTDTQVGVVQTNLNATNARTANILTSVAGTQVSGALSVTGGLTVAPNQTVNFSGNKITGVAAGVASTDVANVSQVTGAIATSKAYTDTSVAEVKANIGAEVAQAINASPAFTAIQNTVSANRKIAAAGAASAISLNVNLPSLLEGESALGMGGGYYDGAAGVSMVYAHALSNSSIVTGGVAYASGGSPAVKVSYAMKW